MKIISVQDSLNIKNTVMIDVRSESEFEEATIPGSINIPVLEDTERSIIGKIYRHESKEKATELGINYASSKLSKIYNEINKYHQQGKDVIIFCWRGGMRSKSVCAFLNSLGLNNVYQMKGGYKAYRNYILDYFEKSDEINFIVLHGLTGVGKTHILNELEKKDQPVLDLEYLAKNSGSVFGNIAFKEKPPSQKMFESYIFNTLYFSKRKVFFVESESKRVGSTQVPGKIYRKIIEGTHVLINTNMNNRINVIKHDYVKANQDEKIIEAIYHLKKKLGNEQVKKLVNSIHEKNYDYVVRILIEKYYDPLYKYSIDQYKDYDLTLDYNKIEDIIPTLMDFYKLVENRIERKSK